MDRKTWNKEFADIIERKAAVSREFAEDAAEASDDSFNDGLTPSEAVDEELSCWGD